MTTTWWKAESEREAAEQQDPEKTQDKTKDKTKDKTAKEETGHTQSQGEWNQDIPKSMNELEQDINIQVELNQYMKPNS